MGLNITDYADGNDREAWIDRLGRYCDDVLPEQAQSSDDEWPVHFDHCFRRIAYDAALGCQWSERVDPPFIEHASLREIKSATGYAMMMAFSGASYADELQHRSLHYRDRLDAE